MRGAGRKVNADADERGDCAMEELKGLELVKEYREHPDRYLPMMDHTEQVPRRNEYGDVNIGWYAGLLGENRPFFAECWAADRITMLTVFIPTKGIEEKTPAELEEWLLEIGYFSFKNEDHSPAEVVVFTNEKKEDFFSVNICVGSEDGEALIDGAPLLPWSVLNDYNGTAAV